MKCKATGPLKVPEKLNNGVPTRHPPVQVKPENSIVPNPIKSRVGALVCGITGPVPLKSPDFRQVYANNMRLNVSPWDLGITFGEIAGEQEGKPIIRETVKIYLTREIAKILSILLKNHIDAFESQFGELKMPFVVVDDTNTESAEPQSEPESKPKS